MSVLRSQQRLLCSSLLLSVCSLVLWQIYLTNNIVKKKRNWTRNNNQKKILFLNNKHNDVEPWKSCDRRPGRWGEPLYSYEKHAMNWCRQVPITAEGLGSSIAILSHFTF